MRRGLRPAACRFLNRTSCRRRDAPGRSGLLLHRARGAAAGSRLGIGLASPGRAVGAAVVPGPRACRARGDRDPGSLFRLGDRRLADLAAEVRQPGSHAVGSPSRRKSPCACNLHKCTGSSRHTPVGDRGRPKDTPKLRPSEALTAEMAVSVAQSMQRRLPSGSPPRTPADRKYELPRTIPGRPSSPIRRCRTADRCGGWRADGDHEHALDEYDDLARESPITSRPTLDSAWIRATCPDPGPRRQRAVSSATRACELTEWKDVGALAVLAAATQKREIMPKP